MNTADHIFQEGVRLHRQARGPEQLRAAAAIYEHVLALKPGHPLVLFQLGQCRMALGTIGDALACFEAASRTMPDFAEAHAARGRALSALGRHDQALSAFDRAVRLNGEMASVWIDHGLTLMAMGRPVDAVASFDAILSRQPDAVEAWLGRANALLAAGRPDEALTSAQRAMAGGAPAQADAELLAGRALVVLGRAEEALRRFDGLLARAPSRGARIGRAQALAGLGRSDLARAELDALLATYPGDAEILNSLGVVLESDGRPEMALANYRAACQAWPGFVFAWVNRGRVARRLEHRQEAAEALRQALRLDTKCRPAMLEMAELARMEGLPDAAEGWRMRADGAAEARPELLVGTQLAVAHAAQCRWEDNARHLEAFRNAVMAGDASVNPFATLAWLDDPALCLRAAHAWTRANHPVGPAWQPEARVGKRIRVAYLSADFHNHATMILAARLFELHDRDRFEIWGISFGPDADDSMRQRAVAAFEHFIDVRTLSDAQVVDLLRGLGIEIAVDLKGYTKDARTGILAARCAPIQIGYLGYPGSMGAEFIDYLIADETVVPAENLRHCQERVIWMPDSYQVNDSTREPPAAATSRAREGLPENGFVFCCFNNFYKIKPEVFAIWMRLLAGVPGSVLWLLGDDETARANLRAEAARHGVAPDRLVFAVHRPIAKHLARLPCADLFLDTLPYGAHTTASDALWAGVPVITRPGRTFSGRVAASLLKSVGLRELICETPEEYEALARRVAGDPAYVRRLRDHLAEARARAPLFDSDRFRRHLESVFEYVWQRRLSGLPPVDCAVLEGGGVTDISGWR